MPSLWNYGFRFYTPQQILIEKNCEKFFCTLELVEKKKAAGATYYKNYVRPTRTNVRQMRKKTLKFSFIQSCKVM